MPSCRSRAEVISIATSEGGGSARGQKRSRDGEQRQDTDGGDERYGIVLRSVDELVFGEASSEEGERKANGYAEYGEHAGLAEDHPHDVAAIGAEGHADADFLRALRGNEGEHSVDAYEREQQGRGGEGSEERESEARAGVAVHVEHLAESHHVQDGLVFVHGINELTHGVGEVVGGQVMSPGGVPGDSN